MKIYIVHLLLCVSILTALFSGEVEAQNTSDKTSDTQFLMIDNFDAPSEKKYAPFRSVDTVISSLGYGIYFRKADAKLSIVPPTETDKALRIQYDVPPFFPWGNWIAIRKEFSPLDLSKYDGVEFELKVEVPSDAMLRLTLSDVQTLQDARKHGEDEMWWADAPDILKTATQKWIKIRAPFADFYLSYGEGVRHNNGVKDLARIVGFEINLVSDGGEHPTGVILVNSLRAYKN